MVKGTTLHSVKREYESPTAFDHAYKYEQLLRRYFEKDAMLRFKRGPLK